MSTKTHPTHALPAESDEVSAWRLEQLESHGFDEALAKLLACDCRFDLHRLIELVERGCPPLLAARILEPSEVEKRTC